MGVRDQVDSVLPGRRIHIPMTLPTGDRLETIDDPTVALNMSGSRKLQPQFLHNPQALDTEATEELDFVFPRFCPGPRDPNYSKLKGGPHHS